MTEQLLNVPFVSRYTEDGARLDCGACCVAMLLAAMAQPTSPIDIAGGRGGCQLSPAALIQSAQTFGLTMFKDKRRTLEDLKRLLDDGQPPIVRLKYGDIPDRLARRSTGAHYVIVVGYDDETEQIFINDPHYPEAGEAGDGGYRRAYTYPVFMEAWRGGKFNALIPVPAPAPVQEGGVSFTQPTILGDVWVIAPLGLRLRAQPEAAGTAVAGGVPFGEHLSAISPESAMDAAGYTWQQVLTAQGVTGWVAASASGNRYLSDAQPIDPYTMYVLDTPAVRRAGGLSAREARDIHATLRESVPIGSQLTVYQRITEADGTPWLWVRTPSGKHGWVREKAGEEALVGEAGKTQRGVHCAPVTHPIPNLVQRLQELDIRWYKMLDVGGDDNLRLITALKNVGIEPVVRIYQGAQFPGRLAELLRQRYGPVRAAGASYIEIGNEPNLACEWREPNDWHNQAQINSIADNWYLDARDAIHAGLKPAIYAMAPTERNRGVHPQYSSVQWLVGMMRRLEATHFAEVKGWLVNEQAWLAVHTADFGLPFDYDPFEGGLDDMCLRGYEIARKVVYDVFGVWPVTISTEGGVYSPKHLRDDLGWPSPYTDAEWGQRLEAMFDYPMQMRAMCPWTFSDEGVHDTRWFGCGWYDRHGNPRSPVMKLKVRKG